MNVVVTISVIPIHPLVSILWDPTSVTAIQATYTPYRLMTHTVKVVNATTVSVEDHLPKKSLKYCGDFSMVYTARTSQPSHSLVYRYIVMCP